MSAGAGADRLGGNGERERSAQSRRRRHGVVIGGGSLNFNAAQSLPSLVLAGGTLGGTAAVTVTGEFDVTATSFLFGSGVLTTRGATLVSMAAGGGFLSLSGGGRG